MKTKFLVTLLVCFAACAQAAEYGKVTLHKAADGVYLFRTTPYGDVGMSGNSVAVITNEYVLMFDSTAIPKTAERILDEVRKITDKPVRYLVNSHWHWDHWGGNEVYQALFPDLQIVSHYKTREQLITVEPKWNDEGLKVGLPAYLDDFEKKLAERKSKQTDAAKLKEMEELLAADRNFLKQKTALKKELPNFTFSESLTLRPSNMEIQIHHAAAITVGDAYIFLPKQKILITGDILLSPYPYAIGGSYPSSWLKTLESFQKLNPSIIIPGHGDIQKPEFLERNIQLFQKTLALVKEAKSNGLTVDQTKELAGKQSAELLKILGNEDPAIVNEFKAYFLNVFVVRAYRELDEPLGELPDGLKQDN